MSGLACFALGGNQAQNDFQIGSPPSRPSKQHPIVAHIADKVGRSEESDQRARVAFIDCFQTASALVDVGIRNIKGFVDVLLPCSSSPPAAHELDVPWEIHRSVLKMSPHIEVSFDDDDVGWPDRNQVVDLIHLRRLYISHTYILNFIRAPALEGIAFVAVESELDCLDDVFYFVLGPIWLFPTKTWPPGLTHPRYSHQFPPKMFFT
ncbi:hypothetical protein C8R43DRAFT_953092 [Mycena crocata]|nr:hypothetical protein C8R43DRAFT_953092 [Mycena crocata]